MNHKTTIPDGGEASDRVAERYLLTEGVTSTVMGPDRGDGRKPGLGHVALFDWDDHVRPVDVVDMARDGVLTGPTFVFESSPGKYHGWNPVVRRFSETAGLLERAGDDTGHLDVGRDRGWWRLRVGNKRHADDHEYKPAPAFVRTVMPAERPSMLRVSDPHLELARVCGVPESHIESVRERYRPVGEGMEVVAYVTMTDIEKKVRRNVWSSEPLDGGD